MTNKVTPEIAEIHQMYLKVREILRNLEDFNLNCEFNVLFENITPELSGLIPDTRKAIDTLRELSGKLLSTEENLTKKFQEEYPPTIRITIDPLRECYDDDGDYPSLSEEELLRRHQEAMDWDNDEI